MFGRRKGRKKERKEGELLREGNDRGKDNTFPFLCLYERKKERPKCPLIQYEREVEERGRF